MQEKMFYASRDEKTGEWSVDVTRHIPAINLTYRELKMVIIALYNSGNNLSRPGLPFAFRHTGKDYKDLAVKIDDHFATLETYHEVTMLAHDTRQDETLNVPSKGAARPKPSNRTRRRKNGNSGQTGKTARKNRLDKNNGPSSKGTADGK